MKKTLKKTIICILSLMVCMAMFPVSAFADEAVGMAEEPAVQEIDDNQTEQAAEETGSVGEEIPDESPGVVVELPDQTLRDETSPEDNEELFAKYVEARLAESVGESAQTEPPLLRQVRLTGSNAVIYEKLRNEIELVANGTNSSTRFNIPMEDFGFERLFWTSEELGVDWVYDGYSTINQEAIDAFYDKILEFDLHKIHNALLFNCPYDLYWYDKTTGVTMNSPSFSVRYFIDDYVLTVSGSFGFNFEVADAYAGGRYKVNTDNAQRVEHAVEKAALIVSGASGLLDYEKLVNYKENICDLVEYDYSALDSSVLYGDPWQVINVFDEDPDTNVVCEGYSKAFKYLCDLTDFDSDIRCVTATGTMSGGTGAGSHMWNIVTMENGLNYLVDVTNCDSGSVGAPDLLFMKGAAGGDVESGYRYSCYGGGITYKYDEDLGDMLDTELEMSMTDYNFAQTEYTEDGLVYLITGDEAILTGYEGQPNHVIIPAEVNAHKVIRIAPEAFYNCTSLTKVYIPHSIKLIGQRAFVGTSLTDIYYEGDSLEWFSLSYYSDAIPDGADCTEEATAEDGHVYTTDYIVDTFSDCTHTGLSHRTCVMCGEVLTKEEPALGHSWNGWTVEKEPNCTEEGQERNFCGRCGAVEYRTIEPMGHTETVLQAKEPTCTETGLTEGKICSVCGEALIAQQVIPAKGHTEEIIPAAEPTCTDAGLTEGKRCTVCGETITAQKTVPALGHNWDEGEVIKEATDDEDGEMFFKCRRCGETRTEVIPKLKPDITPGWYQNEDGAWYYYDDNCEAATGWKKLSSKWYYFDASGVMATGWQKIGAKWYYFKSNGAMATSWQKISNKWYYFNASGVMQIGWQKISGKDYFFKSSGAMAANEWVKGYYWINKDGTWTYKYKASWKKSGSKWWFADTSGWYAKNTSITIDGKRYTFDKSGWLIS